MIRNYFIIAWRNLLKHKVVSVINLLGLTVAFTICVLLVMGVYHELSYDQFHENRKEIYHPYFVMQRAEGRKPTPYMTEPMLRTLKERFPAVKQGSRYYNRECELVYNGKHFIKQIAYVDADFFRMFNFPLVQGSALNDRDNIVLDEETAKAMFGEEEPVGKQLKMQSGGSWHLYTVTGITQNIPANSSFSYSVATLFENNENYPEQVNNWHDHNHHLFIQLAPGTDRQQFEAGLQPFINTQFKHIVENLKLEGAKASPNGQYMEMLLQPFSNLHTDNSIYGWKNAVSRTYLNMLLIVAGFVLLVACINFINLSIGKSFTRTREIGLRKSLGAEPRQVVMQFWGEAVLICLLALLITIPLCYFLLPYYRELFGSSVTTAILFKPVTIACILGGFLLVTIIAGGYPAWKMSRLDAVNILKGRLKLKTSGSMRGSLIISQFAIAILLISCTWITWQQLHYLRNHPVGYNSTQVISIPVGTEVNGKDALELLRQKMAGNPSVLNITGLSKDMGLGMDGQSFGLMIALGHKNKSMHVRWLSVGHDFVKTMGLQLLEGRDFLGTDSTGLVINEEMARLLGEESAVGVRIRYDSVQAPSPIIGVVKNFNYESLHHPIQPLALVMHMNIPISHLFVKVRPDNLPEMMDKLSAAWAGIAPHSAFKGSFVDANVNRQYAREEQLTRIFIYAAIAAVILSCLGLFALAVLVITQRTKEIGIRKAMGASAGNILQLITHDFVKLILVAMAVAAPLAWYFMNKWLAGFAFSIEIEWWWLAGAGLLALLVALCTIGHQSLKAAFTHPIRSLKSE